MSFLETFAHYSAICALFAASLVPIVTAQGCDDSCTVSADAALIGWYELEFNTTLTAATVIQVVNTDLHTTRLSTIYNELPAGYTAPTNTNADGTQTTRVLYTRTGELTCFSAFPSTFTSWPQAYTWSGVLSTTDKNGQSICSTAVDAPISIDYYSEDSNPVVTMPTHPAGPDPKGLLFKPTAYKINVATIYQTAFPSASALQSCTLPSAFPAVAAYSARYVTDTSTSYEGGTSTDDPSSTGSNVIIKTTQSVRTVVSDGPSGPVTSTQTVDVTYAQATSTSQSNAGRSVASNGLLAAICLAVIIAI